MDRYDSDIQLTTPTAKEILEEKKVTLFVLLGIRVLSVLGVGRRQEYGTKWNVIHNSSEGRDGEVE